MQISQNIVVQVAFPISIEHRSFTKETDKFKFLGPFFFLFKTINDQVDTSENSNLKLKFNNDNYKIMTIIMIKTT